MNFTQIALLVYGFFLLSGAYFGIKAGSKISLIMGLLSGALVFVGVWLTKSNPTLGYRFLTGMTGLLSVMFVMRLIKTQKFMPSGMLLTVTVIALGLSLYQLLAK